MIKEAGEYTSDTEEIANKMLNLLKLFALRKIMQMNIGNLKSRPNRRQPGIIVRI